MYYRQPLFDRIESVSAGLEAGIRLTDADIANAYFVWCSATRAVASIACQLALPHPDAAATPRMTLAEFTAAIEARRRHE